MRNWNIRWDITYIFLQRFTSYLWGIETYRTHPLYTPYHQIHILPMRNWNSYRTPLSFFCSFHSHPTYEELKPMCRTGHLLQSSDSHPTYEELKHMNFKGAAKAAGEFTSYLWGIETPILFSFSRQPSQIHILPMRNWNKADTTYGKWRLIIHILPMRNWNFSSYPSIFSIY